MTREFDMDLRYSVLTLPQSSNSWYLVDDFLKLRKKIFVESMNWSLWGDDHREFEEYDGGSFPHYVLAHSGESVTAGCRLIRCDTEFGVGHAKRSYTITDAFLGRIGLPPELWNDGAPPSDNKCWELTRFASLTSDQSVARTLLDVASEYIRVQGATRCICLSTPPMFRLARRYGFDPTRRSNILGNRDGRFLTFECKIKSQTSF